MERRSPVVFLHVTKLDSQDNLNMEEDGLPRIGGEIVLPREGDEEYTHLPLLSSTSTTATAAWDSSLQVVVGY